MAKVTAAELVAFAKSKLGVPYVYGMKGTVITYCIKSFKETKEEEKVAYLREKNGVEQEEAWTNKEV